MVVNSAELFRYDHPLYLNDNDYSRDKKIVSFKTFMSQRDVDPIVDLYDVPSSYTSDRMEYSYVPETHRSNIGLIIKFFCELHKKNLSLESFNESNIVFHRGQLKFCGLKFVQRLNDADRKHDLTLLCNAIENLFKSDTYNKKNYEIPTPILHLLDDIQNYRDAETTWHATIESILSDHLAIQPHDKACEVIANFHDLKERLPRYGRDKVNYDKAVAEMQTRDEYKNHWLERFTVVSNPQAGALIDCINHKFPRGKEGFQYYVDEGTPRVVNANILKGCRNDVNHLGKHLLKHIGDGVISSKKDFELITMAFFDKELLSFQSLTYKYQIAHLFVPDYTPSAVPAQRGSMPSNSGERRSSRQDNTSNSSTTRRDSTGWRPPAS